MCKFCNVECGNAEMVEEVSIGITIGNRIINDVYSLSVFMSHEDEAFRLMVDSWLDGDSENLISIPLNYCPKCGRKLT